MLFKTLRDAYKLLSKEISQFEAGEIIASATGKSRSELPVFWDDPLSEEQIKAIEDILSRRLAGEPLQYILGEWEFYGYPFIVGEGVLIPRPDTEILVETALEVISSLESPKVLDLCSGSGAVAIAIDKENKSADVTAVELSEKALSFLRENIRINSSDVHAVNADALKYKHHEKFDLIVSNPPYIRSGDIEGLQEEVKKEPAMALDGGEDGLFFYSRFPKLYYNCLNNSGVMAFEIGIGQEKEVAGFLESAGFRNVQFRKDLSGIIRVVLAEK